MDQPVVLIIHEDAAVRALLGRMLPAFGWRVLAVTSGEEGFDQLAQGQVTVVLLDLDLPGMSGEDTLRAIRAMSPAPEVVVTSARGTVTAAAEVARHGAFDFVPQPFDFKDLNHILGAAHDQATRRRQTLHLEAALRAHDPFPEIVGRSAGIKRVLALVNKAARTLSPVLIQGESGTGKELVARALHANSPRATSPLTIVDCGALQDTLLESELFGHERGAFTGAHGLKHGLLEMANLGTLFLDEIGEMSPATQVKVLRALQSGEFRRIGSNRHIKADIRLIAATNKDLREEAQRGRFREDLYYRIAVIEIHMPALRERTDDIPFLVEHFLKVNAYGGRERLQVTPEAMECLVRYPWPGNIRELRNVIERLSVLADSPVLTVDALPPAIAKAALEPDGAG
ncbi:MAG: sigma-54-dependent transcriptional regulator, partial [Candidatus Rokuibacteriota bacterium]